MILMDTCAIIWDALEPEKLIDGHYYLRGVDHRLLHTMELVFRYLVGQDW